MTDKGFKMSYLKDTKKVIEIYAKVAIPLREEFGDKIKITLGDMDISKEREGHYISASKIGSNASDSISMEFHNEIKKFTDDVREMMYKAAWIRVDKICIDMIGAKLHLDKEKEVVVEAISKNGVLLDNGDTVESTRLFKKD